MLLLTPQIFLRALQCKMSSICKDPFNFNSQQDVPEILGVVLKELKGDSSLVENVLPITLCTTITCNTCFCSSIKEDKSDILILPTFNQISSSLNESLKPEPLSGEHMWSCQYVCSHFFYCTSCRILYRAAILQNSF